MELLPPHRPDPAITNERRSAGLMIDPERQTGRTSAHLLALEAAARDGSGVYITADFREADHIARLPVVRSMHPARFTIASVDRVVNAQLLHGVSHVAVDHHVWTSLPARQLAPLVQTIRAHSPFCRVVPQPRSSTGLLFSERWATITFDDRYRYRLGRRWAADGPIALFIMLNPSTADALADDPTIRRCVGFAKRWGCAAVEVVNLFGYRATHPTDLQRSNTEWGNRGPGNDQAVVAAMAEVTAQFGYVIAAWGSTLEYDPAHIAAVRHVARTADELGVSLDCLGVTASGSPRHPLYLKGDIERRRWVPSTARMMEPTLR